MKQGMNRGAYENTLATAIEAVEHAQNIIRERPYSKTPLPLETLSQEEYIAYRKLRQIHDALEILLENSHKTSSPKNR